MERPKPSPAHPHATQAASADAGHDLAPDVVARIEELFAQLDDLDHYRLLGIPRNATRAQVRTAFLRAAPPFHPDRYFGKRLGALGPKMQKVFARFTLAHDTLVADERRIKYDATLLPETKPPPPPQAEREREAEAAPPPVQSATVPVAQPPKRGSGSISVTPDAANRARREAFAARLSGRHSSTQIGRPSSAQIRAATASAPTPPPARPSSPEAAKAATDALRRRYEEQVLGAKERHLSTHVQQAQAAAAKGDFEAAASHYREAMALSADPAIKAGYEDAVARSKRVVSDASLDQARDFESQKQWAEAAAAYARVFNLAPSAEVAYRAANAFRRHGVDPRRAAHFGEEAVKLEPNDPAYRLTLALIYIDAGLMLRARGELDRAQALDPKHPMIRDVLAKLRLR